MTRRPRAAEFATIVLAAGASSRMGRPKMLLPVGDRTLLAASVAPHLEALNGRVVVVLGKDARRIRAEAGLPADPRLHVVVNRRWRDGMSSSLRRGLEVCGDADAVLIALGDQPSLAPSIIPALLAARRTSPKLIVAPRYRDGQGNPVLFKREIFPELLRLTGDQGARPIIQKEPARVEWVDLDLPMPPDVDTLDDYEKIRANLRAGNHAV